MKKLLAFFVLVVGSLVLVEACTDLQTKTAGHIGTYPVSTALVVAVVLAYLLLGKGK